MTGVVRKKKDTEGFGFVKGEDGQDRFFHKTSLVAGEWEAIEETVTQVTFDHQDGQNGKGPRAVNVRVVG